jgi:uncharacterized membrane protein
MVIMTTLNKYDWLIPIALIALSAVPAIAGSFRLVQLGSGGSITEDNVRIFAESLPVVIHIICSVIFCLLGAFQFSGALRRLRPGWHRTAGWILVPCGLVAAFAGLWMTQFYPTTGFDGGGFLYAIRLLARSAMAVFLCLGLIAIRKRDIPGHAAWMSRGYALGLGAGTQALTHLPWFLFPSIHGELARTVLIAAGWVINLAVAEWSISRQLATDVGAEHSLPIRMSGVARPGSH